MDDLIGSNFILRNLYISKNIGDLWEIYGMITWVNSINVNDMGLSENVGYIPNEIPI